MAGMAILSTLRAQTLRMRTGPYHWQSLRRSTTCSNRTVLSVKASSSCVSSQSSTDDRTTMTSTREEKAVRRYDGLLKDDVVRDIDGISRNNSRKGTTSCVEKWSNPLYSTLISEMSRTLAIQLADKQFRVLSMSDVPDMEGSPSDLQLRYTGPSQATFTDIPVLAVQIAFSRRPSWNAAPKLLLNASPHINVVMRVNLKEKMMTLPPSRSIASKKDTARMERLEAPLSPQTLERGEIKLQDPADPHSPLLFRGVQWVGTLVGELEVWVRDPATGEAIQRGRRVQFYGRDTSANIDLRVSDLVPYGGNGKYSRRQVVFDWKRWTRHLDLARKMLVDYRYRRFLKHPGILK